MARSEYPSSTGRKTSKYTTVKVASLDSDAQDFVEGRMSPYLLELLKSNSGGGSPPKPPSGKKTVKW